jgi:hypothetical protein
VHDSRLGRLGLQAQTGQDRRDLAERVLGLASGLAHQHEIVGVAHQYRVAIGLPLPVEPMQIDVG